jgi:hypothetical protein
MAELRPILIPALPPSPAGGCDNGVKMWNLQTNQQQQVAQHAAPIRHCFFLRQHNMLVTGSWDKTVKYWDLRTPNPVHTQQMPERVYAMDVQEELMVVGTADRQLQVGRSGACTPPTSCARACSAADSQGPGRQQRAQQQSSMRQDQGRLWVQGFHSLGSP